MIFFKSFGITNVIIACKPRPMNKKLQHLIENLTSEIVFEVLRGFNLNKFKKFDDPFDRIKYAKDNLPLLGVGTSRSVFALSGDKVLKIAGDYEIAKYVYNKHYFYGNVDENDRALKRNKEEFNISFNKGLAQNQEEVSTFTNPKLKPITTEIYDAAGDYSWIISEIAKPFVSNKQFANATKLQNLESWNNFLEAYKDYHGDLGLAVKDAAEKLLNWHISFQSKYPDNVDKTPEAAEKWVLQTLVENPITKAVLLLIDSGTSVGDLVSPGHWGVTASGKIVLLDYGLTEDIFYKYYY